MLIRGEIKVLLCFPIALFCTKSFLGVIVPLFLEISPLFQRWWDIVPNFEISLQNTGCGTKFVQIMILS